MLSHPNITVYFPEYQRQWELAILHWKKFCPKPKFFNTPFIQWTFLFEHEWSFSGACLDSYSHTSTVKQRAAQHTCSLIPSVTEQYCKCLTYCPSRMVIEEGLVIKGGWSGKIQNTLDSHTCYFNTPVAVRCISAPYCEHHLSYFQVLMFQKSSNSFKLCPSLGTYQPLFLLAGDRTSCSVVLSVTLDEEILIVYNKRVLLTHSRHYKDNIKS